MKYGDFIDFGKPFYKAQLHFHSTESDGKLSVEEQKKLFKERGYSVVVFTDHEHLVDNSYLDDDDFLTITSCEVAIKEDAHSSTLKNRTMRAVRLNLYALDQHNVITPCYNSVYGHYTNDEVRLFTRSDSEYERVFTPECINDMIRITKAADFLVSYNHPNWSLDNASDYLKYEALDFVEIYNHSCTMSGEDSYIIKAFDDFLRADKIIFATMCDDSHRFEKIFGGWVMIHAEKLDYATIMQGLQAGNFYSSNGPEIYSLIRENDSVTVKTSAAKRIALSTRGRRCAVIWGEGVTEATFQLQLEDGYFRIKVDDMYGNQAYTQSFVVKAQK